jgi:hypothetical protein
LKKKQGKKKSDVSRLTRQDLVKNSVAIHWLLFFFFTKTTSFWFFLKKNWPGGPGQNLKPKPWTGPDLKTMENWSKNEKCGGLLEQ